MNDIKILEMAYLSQNVYEAKNKLPEYMNNWFIPKNFKNLYSPTSDFFARLYLRKNQAGQMDAAVVAFRGTMPLQHLTNDIADFQIALLHELPIRYQAARVFFHKARSYVRENYPGVRIKLTGHSLGGALAQLIAAKNKQIAVVFNSPGIADLPEIHSSEHYQPYIHNINSTDDAIHKIGRTIGTVQNIDVIQGEQELQNAEKVSYKITDLPAEIVLKAEYQLYEKSAGAFKQHLIANMIDALQHHPDIASVRY